VQRRDIRVSTQRRLDGIVYKIARNVAALGNTNQAVRLTSLFERHFDSNDAPVRTALAFE
jgi:hypothetical protein